MKKNRALQRALVVGTLVACACLCASRANAASVYIWVAEGSSVVGYTNTGVSENTLTAPTGGWGDAFSVTTYGTNSTNQFVVVSDASKHTLSEYSYNASSNTSAQVATTFSFPADPAGGAISPQEIAIDSNGNLWTTSAGGAVTEYCGAAAGCTINAVLKAAGTVMQTVTLPSTDGAPRGIMFDSATSKVYVTTSGFGNTGGVNDGVYDFTLAGTGLAGSVSNLVTQTVASFGGSETGQLRGVTYDAAGNIYWADSTWGAAGTDQGYINEGNFHNSHIVSGLNGPNEIEVGAGTSTTVTGLTSSCDVIYDANYYAGTIEEISTGITTGGGSTGCGSADSATLNLISGLTTATASGVALAFGESALGGEISPVGPDGLFTADTAAPEPGTWVLALSVLLIGVAFIKARRGVSAKVSQS